MTDKEFQGKDRNHRDYSKVKEIKFIDSSNHMFEKSGIRIEHGCLMGGDVPHPKMKIIDTQEKLIETFGEPFKPNEMEIYESWRARMGLRDHRVVKVEDKGDISGTDKER